MQERKEDSLDDKKRLKICKREGRGEGGLEKEERKEAIRGKNKPPKTERKGQLGVGASTSSSLQEKGACKPRTR